MESTRLDQAEVMTFLLARRGERWISGHYIAPIFFWLLNLSLPYSSLIDTRYLYSICCEIIKEEIVDLCISMSQFLNFGAV